MLASIEAFDATAFRSELLQLFYKAVDVVVTVTPGSVTVDARIVMLNEDDAQQNLMFPPVGQVSMFRRRFYQILRSMPRL